MRFLILIFVLVMAAPAFADSFGQRFGNEPPFALKDTLDPTTVISIQPAAGDEVEEAMTEETAAEEVIEAMDSETEAVSGAVTPEETQAP